VLSTISQGKHEVPRLEAEGDKGRDDDRKTRPGRLGFDPEGKNRHFGPRGASYGI
jgi:hypothetical protein